MVNPFLYSPFSLRVNVSKYICDSPKLLHWKRNHRKARINKKWHKKYGAIYSTCPGKCYQLAGDIIVCPHAKAELDKLIKEQHT